MKDIKTFLIQDILLHQQKGQNVKVHSEWEFIKRNRLKIPALFLGTGISGIISGAFQIEQMIKDYLKSSQIEADIIPVGSIGVHSLEPLLDVQLPGKCRISFKQVSIENVTEILDSVFHHIIPMEYAWGQYKSEYAEPWENVPFIEDMPYFRYQKRVVLENVGKINPESIEEYIVAGGYKAFLKIIRFYSGEQICELVESSGLRGRGGGGFLTGTKWKMALNTTSDHKYVICNADESDPGAFMDREMMAGDPHKLMEGIAIASYAIGASKAIIHIRNRYKHLVRRLEKAIKDAEDYGILGVNIFDSGFNLTITIRKGPGAYVCGEETALISSLEGKRGMPSPKPPYPAKSGYKQMPTVVNNVETLMNIPCIVKNGPNWFRAMGTKNSKGTKVFAISGKVKMKGLYEVEMGTPLRKVIFDMAGGMVGEHPFKAVFLGGPAGGCLPGSELDAPVDYEELRNHDTYMGSGGMVVLDESNCIVDTVKYFMNFIQKESCGKCIPCREGTKRMFEILDKITHKPQNEGGHETLERFKGVMQLEGLAGVLKDTSLCGLGQTAAGPVLSSLKWFREEFEEHIFDRNCSAGICQELRSFYIDVDQCTGCMVCAGKCPSNAIIGMKRKPHFIVEERCTSCGKCYEVCKFNAVLIQ